MPDRYTGRILSHLADPRYELSTVRQLARDLRIDDEEFDDFHAAIDRLLEDRTLVLGSSDTIALPPPGPEMVGTFRKHERGFGFIIPDELTQHGDLFVPPGKTGDAMTGDRVRAKVRHEGKRGSGKSPYVGVVTEVLERADRRYAGVLIQKGNQFLVEVDGRQIHDPLVVRDPHAKNAKPGDKVVIEIIDYPTDEGPGRRQLGEAVIVEVLGDAGEPDVETVAVMRAFGLADEFPQAVREEARAAARSLDEAGPIPKDREDLTDPERYFITTIDPPDAKDFDDAIHLKPLDPKQEGDGAAWELGVHIADVAYYIRPGTAIDEEAYTRGNSTYLPRKVVPMLPEILSNGVCSLQPGVRRYAKSCFIRYDRGGKVLGARFARSVIKSAKRMTYLEAQALIDGDLREARKHGKDAPSDEGGIKYPRELIQSLKWMDELAKTIRKRRFKQGMIVLNLPEVELIYDESGRVIDAQPEDDAFTHTIIEMFMVEANEAAARAFDRLDVPMIRRVHPDPDAHDVGELQGFARVAGFNIPQRPSRKELQGLLDAVRGKPAEHAVHLAVLRTLSKAEYAPMLVGHFALASEHYTHFTSPIRRYPDLIVHRGLDAIIDAQARMFKGSDAERPRHLSTRQHKHIGREVAQDDRVPDELKLRDIGRHCSTTERNSESAERELRSYLVLELMAEHLGDDFPGTVTGVTGAGAFVQIDRYLIDGFVATSDLPGARNERWRLNPNTGALVAQRSGRAITIGNRFTVRIAEVDLSRRRMELVVIEDESGKTQKRNSGKSRQGKKPSSRQQSRGAKQAHQQAMQLKRSKQKSKSKNKKKNRPNKDKGKPKRKKK
ncbi:MAG: VacB/RNase II family 3'-5' exoribonuclease [Planctomycetes bacterium]|jgi:ribonuclease R|nr:VacB/RNase II family 3'-5' exoribonuclease [Planctomycetota bacterium]